MRDILLLLIIFVLMASNGQALRLISGDLVSIDEPIADDVLAVGNSVTVNAPVDSLMVAGGTVMINAPVSGDVALLSGQSLVNAPVGGKLVAAGGTIALGSQVSRNAILAGGMVNLNRDSLIGRDALIAASTVNNAGRVNGTMIVSADTMQGNGTVGRLEYHRTQEKVEQAARAPQAGAGLFSAVMALGWLIAGLLLLRFFPSTFDSISSEISSSPLVKAVMGFLGIVAILILVLILAMTVIGIPSSLMLLIFYLGALLLANLFVSYSLGRSLVGMAHMGLGEIAAYLTGFVVLHLLFLVPVLGGILALISTSLGFGAIVHALYARARA